MEQRFLPARVPALGTHFILVVVAIFGFCFATEADEQFRAPGLFFDGSLPLQYTNNATHSMNNRESDFYSSPYLKITAAGEVADSVRYSLYASTGADTLFKYTDNDVSSNSFGFQLRESWDALVAGAFVERNYYYNKIYDGVFNTANDIGFFTHYNYVDSSEKWRIRPGITITTRITDAFTVERDLFNIKVDFERRLAERWWALLTPRLRIYDYVNRSSGRIDLISSVATGLRYEMTKNVDLTSAIAYESRSSGLSGRNFNSMIASVSLDFSFEAFNPDRPLHPDLIFRDR